MPTLSITRSIEINAPVEQVFRFIADPCRRMSAMSRVFKRRIAVSDVVASPDGVVRSYSMTTRFFWLPFSTTIAGIRAEHVANKRIVDKALVFTKDVDDFTLEPSGNGTRLTWRYELTTPRALIKIWERLTAKGKRWERLIEEPLAQFKRELENEPKPA